MTETEFKSECIRYAYLKRRREHTQYFTNAEMNEMISVGDKIIQHCIDKLAKEEQE